MTAKTKTTHTTEKKSRYDAAYARAYRARKRAEQEQLLKDFPVLITLDF